MSHPAPTTLLPLPAKDWATAPKKLGATLAVRMPTTSSEATPHVRGRGMRNAFFSHYRPTDAEFKEIWKSCHFAVDANVLLDFYRYTAQTQGNLLEILTALKPRLFLPHQAALEYHRNRLQAIADVRKPYKEIRQISETFSNDFNAKLSSFSSKHPTISMKEIREIIEEAHREIGKRLDQAAERHPNILDDPEADDIRAKLAELFNEAAGPPYPAERLSEIHELGDSRYKAKKPPGYRDAGKSAPERYGDLVLWYQLIDHSKEKKVPIIFVTGDVKEDWWLVFQGRTIGPRPELREEFRLFTKQVFYMYETSQFMTYASEFIEVRRVPQAIGEVEEVRRVRLAAEIATKQLEQAFRATQQELQNVAKGAADAARLAAPISRRTKAHYPERLWQEVLASLANPEVPSPTAKDENEKDRNEQTEPPDKKQN